MSMIKSNREIWGVDFPLGGEPRKERGTLGCRCHRATYTWRKSRALDGAP